MHTVRLNLGAHSLRHLKLQNIIVIFDPPESEQYYHHSSPLKVGNSYLFLGEIGNMPGHGIFSCLLTKNILSGYHLDDFWLEIEGVELKQINEETWTISDFDGDDSEHEGEE